MLKMIRGCGVPKSYMLKEEYQATEYGFIANVGADKISVLFRRFIDLQTVPLFFILELPTNKADEELLYEDRASALHKDVFYIDGLSNKQANMLLDKYGELLINDGLTCFGFGTFDSSAEIMKQKYNVVALYTAQRDKYSVFFKDHDIPPTENIVTAWDTFSERFPGESSRMEVDGKDVYNILDELKEWGLYFAERRVDG